jgi:hypothetical protein
MSKVLLDEEEDEKTHPFKKPPKETAMAERT